MRRSPAVILPAVLLATAGTPDVGSPAAAQALPPSFLGTPVTELALHSLAEAPPEARDDLREPEGNTPGTAGEPTVDPCLAPPVALGPEFIDRVHRGLHRTVCRTALWFDSLFGDPSNFDEYRGTYGRLRVGIGWDDIDGIEEDTHFAAKVDFPNLEERLNAFVGRFDRDDLVEDRQRNIETIPAPVLGIPDDDEWLVGLGYTPRRGRRSKLSFDLGADIEFPMNPFLRARYRHRYSIGSASQIQVRHALFWEREDGYGTTHRFDLDHLLGEKTLFRWRNVGTLSEGDQGLDWYSESTIYRRLAPLRAMALQFSIDGETDAPVRLESYLLRVIYRESIFRPWLFLDVRPGVAWRREEHRGPRETAPFVTVSLEILFGERR